MKSLKHKKDINFLERAIRHPSAVWLFLAALLQGAIKSNKIDLMSSAMKYESSSSAMTSHDRLN